MTVEPPSGTERAYVEAYRESTAMPDAARERVWARLSGGPLGPVGGEAANDPGVHEVVSSGGWLTGSGPMIAAAVAVVTGAVVLGLLARDRPSSDSSSGMAAVELVDRESPRAVEPKPRSVPVASGPVVSGPLTPRSVVKLDESAQAEPVIERSAARARSKAARREQPRQASEPKQRPSSLADERELIEQAHAALGRGEPERTLALLRQHSRDYAAGIFVEEREALQAVATCTAGQLENGRAAAKKFLASYPDAVLAARVRNSCALED